jgi:hypothetical protein
MLGNQSDGTFKIENLQVAEKPKKRLSISQLEQLTKCGVAYEKRYIKHIPSPFGLSLYVGSAVDHAVTRNLEAKMQSGMLLTVNEVGEIAAQKYDREVSEAEEISLKDDEKEIGKVAAIANGQAKAIRLAKLHAIEFAPSIEPIHLQRSLFLELPGYPFDIGGVLDIQEHDRVRDTKTAGKTPAKSVADTSDQLTVYAMLVMFNDGYIPKELTLDYLVDNKTPITKQFTTERTEEDFDVLLRRINVACQAIETGIFLPARESDWWCGPSCGYYANCAFVKRSRRPAA